VRRDGSDSLGTAARVFARPGHCDDHSAQPGRGDASVGSGAAMGEGHGPAQPARHCHPRRPGHAQRLL